MMDPRRGFFLCLGVNGFGGPHTLRVLRNSLTRPESTDRRRVVRRICSPFPAPTESGVAWWGPTRSTDAAASEVVDGFVSSDWRPYPRHGRAFRPRKHPPFVLDEAPEQLHFESREFASARLGRRPRVARSRRGCRRTRRFPPVRGAGIPRTAACRESNPLTRASNSGNSNGLVMYWSAPQANPRILSSRGPSAQDQHGHLHMLFAEFLQHRVPAHLGEHEVENDQIEGSARRCRGRFRPYRPRPAAERRRSVPHQRGLIALRFAVEFDETTDVLLVFDDKNGGLHARGSISVQRGRSGSR